MDIESMIDESVYTDFIELMPIVCVDVVIHEGEWFVLVKRNREPAKGLWWTPGGRLYKNETLQEGAVRKAKEEVGLDVAVERLVGVYDCMFPFSHQGPSTHAVDVVFLVKPRINDIDSIRIDSTSSGLLIVNRLGNGCHPHIRKVISDSGLGSGTG
jgi:colanic acid biosynthesis protein WcaH